VAAQILSQAFDGRPNPVAQFDVRAAVADLISNGAEQLHCRAHHDQADDRRGQELDHG
jgi:hypothetical protein